MSRPPSLRRRLLAFLVLPMALAWLASGVLVYVLALHYANISYDRALTDMLHALQRMIRSDARYQELSPQTRILFEVDSEDPNYYTVRSMRHGTLAANLELPLPDPLPKPDAKPRLESLAFGDRNLRIASLAIASEESGDGRGIRDHMFQLRRMWNGNGVNGRCGCAEDLPDSCQ